jgi:hypothetical protein
MRTVLVVSADKHSGSTMGLIPDEPLQLHDGGNYNPSPLQKILWKQYNECLDFIRQERKRSRLIYIENGDICEGIHHQTTQIVCPRVETHENIASDILDYTFKKIKFTDGDRAYMVAGTEAHAASGNQSENRVATDLECFTPQYTETSGKNNRFVWDRLLLKINGVLFDIAHHGGSAGRRAWTTENGMRNLVKSFYFESLENKTELPRYWVRSHLHQFIYSGIYSGKNGNIEGFVTPSFQMKTGFAYKVAGTSLSDIGMLVFIIEDNGDSRWKVVKLSYKQDRIIEV